MATEEATATPKQNRGNRRTGRARGYRGQKGGAHTVSWRDDKVCMERIRIVVYPLWLKRQPASAILPVANVLMKQMNEPEIQLTTIYEDLKRCEALAREDQQAVADKVVMHLAEYDELIRLMYDALADKSASLSNVNRDRLYGYIAQVIERKAKLDGSLDQGSRYGGQTEVPELGPSPAELLASGRWTRAKFEIWMETMGEASGVTPPRQLLEGQAREVVAEEAEEDAVEQVARSLDLPVLHSPQGPPGELLDEAESFQAEADEDEDS
jgi:hypothetical protein